MTRRWRFAVIGTAAAVLALIAGGVLYVRGGSTPVPLDEVVERFRESTPAPASSAARAVRTTGVGASGFERVPRQQLGHQQSVVLLPRTVKGDGLS